MRLVGRAVLAMLARHLPVDQALELWRQLRRRV
jgi:ABC-type thiamine transport system substrate-binding protein